VRPKQGKVESQSDGGAAISIQESLEGVDYDMPWRYDSTSVPPIGISDRASVMATPNQIGISPPQSAGFGADAPLNTN
jgi:hypothetical protein